MLKITKAPRRSTWWISSEPCSEVPGLAVSVATVTNEGWCLTSYFPPANFRWEEVASFTME